MRKVKLNVLDQSPIFDGQTAVDAINRTIAMAKAVEEMGFSRYWVAEHHNQMAFASAAPEMMALKLATETSRIRIGTAGILVGHYAPLKVAETVRMLATFCPDRFDFGMGRSPGAVHGALEMLGNHKFTSKMINAKQDAVYDYLDGNKAVVASPQNAPDCQRWVLGASPGSALYAAQRGLSYAFAGFANPDLAKDSIEAYRSHFKPSRLLAEPVVNMALSLYCAETTAQAQRLNTSTKVWYKLADQGGQNIAFPTIQASEAYLANNPDPQFDALINKGSIVGDSEQVMAQLHQMIESLQLDEITLLTVTESADDLLNHYRLVSQGLNISP